VSPTRPVGSAGGGTPDPQWVAVEDWFDSRLLGSDDTLDAVLRASAAAGLPPIAVSAAQGAFLHLLASGIRAERILEVGTLGGYSTIWLARALPPNGQLVTCEIDPHHADVARANLELAGVADRVDLVLGPAANTLESLAARGVDPFDLVFVDADKPSNADYVRWALRLTRPHALIVVDNVVRHGRILDESPDTNARGVHQVVDLIASEPRLRATALQTVGGKGWDGFVIAQLTD
jgi:predicted O-methyltransferase YrrM